MKDGARTGDIARCEILLWSIFGACLIKIQITGTVISIEELCGDLISLGVLGGYSLVAQ